jgi:hypothetical protein
MDCVRKRAGAAMRQREGEIGVKRYRPAAPEPG